LEEPLKYLKPAAEKECTKKPEIFCKTLFLTNRNGGKSASLNVSVNIEDREY
jgi:hypothetical protein